MVHVPAIAAARSVSYVAGKFGGNYIWQVHYFSSLVKKTIWQSLDIGAGCLGMNIRYKGNCGDSYLYFSADTHIRTTIIQKSNETS